MKKIITIFFLFINGFLAVAQEQGAVSLNWIDKKPFSYGNYSLALPQFNIENYQFDSYTKKLNYSLTIRLNIPVNENSLQLTNLVFEPIPESQLGDLSLKEIPSTLKYSLKTGRARDEYFGQIIISPIIKEGNSFKKLVSFNYTIAQNQNNKSGFAVNNVTAVENSVLNSGSWYRFYVQKSGVYKITKSFLQSLGLNTNVDPRKIKIFGNGGRMLPLLNSTYYPMDLEENAIQFIGESDGTFNDEDYILFYAEGMDNWNDDYNSHLNIYADKSYYYVTVQGDDGKRITDMSQPSGNINATYTTFDDYQFHEIDEVNIAKLGRIWFGESFSIDNEQEFKFTFPNLVTSSPITVTAHNATVAFTATTFKIEANSQPIATMSFSAETSLFLSLKVRGYGGVPLEGGF